ncbi:hypothetical protein Tco_0109688 [Tanacetum coccineum]
MEYDKETVELQSMMEVIPDEEEVAVNDIPLATKPPSIEMDIQEKEQKESQKQPNQARDGKDKFNPKPKSVKSQPHEENTT